MIALVAALDVEAAVLAESLERSSIASPKVTLSEGVIEGAPVVLAVAGVGKVAAAIATQFLCDTFKPGAVICFGLAGAIAGAEPGQVIVATGAIQHDMDARPLTGRKGDIPGLGRGLFEADERLVQDLFHAASGAVDRPEVVRRGMVLSGDQIISAADVRERLIADFPDAACVDMETAAVAQVASQNGIPWGAVRVTSDSADETFDLDEVLEFGARTAGELFARIVLMAATEIR